jgi:hypothetical protein
LPISVISVEGRLVTAADQNHLALIFVDFKMADYLNGIGLTKREIEHNQVGR